MYYLIEISTGDSKISGKAIYTYTTENDAIANFHSKIGIAMKSELYNTELLMAIDENGKVLEQRRYIKPDLRFDNVDTVDFIAATGITS